MNLSSVSIIQVPRYCGNISLLIMKSSALVQFFCLTTKIIPVKLSCTGSVQLDLLNWRNVLQRIIFQAVTVLHFILLICIKEDTPSKTELVFRILTLSGPVYMWCFMVQFARGQGQDGFNGESEMSCFSGFVVFGLNILFFGGIIISYTPDFLTIETSSVPTSVGLAATLCYMCGNAMVEFTSMVTVSYCWIKDFLLLCQQILRKTSLLQEELELVLERYEKLNHASQSVLFSMFSTVQCMLILAVYKSFSVGELNHILNIRHMFVILFKTSTRCWPWNFKYLKQIQVIGSLKNFSQSGSAVWPAITNIYI